MSVIVTLRISADPAAFERELKANSDVVDRIMEAARGHGCTAHRWVASDGQVMAIDEWPDGDSFHAFFSGSEAEIGPLMQAVGVTAPPEATVWEKLVIGDELG